MLPSVDRVLPSSAKAMPLAALGSQLDQPQAAKTQWSSGQSQPHIQAVHLRLRPTRQGIVSLFSTQRSAAHFSMCTSEVHLSANRQAISQHSSQLPRHYPRHELCQPLPARSRDLLLTSSASKCTSI